MIDKIKNFFDDFSFYARVMPVIVLLLPIVLIGLFDGVINDDWFEKTTIIVFSIIFFSITSKVARNFGKAYEKKMYEQLGNMPTTIVLRFTDKTFDTVTKQRYHSKLNQFEGLKLPLDESSETLDDDQQYISAVNLLRNYANSNRDKEQRVYQELKEYNFWRNMYGSKKIALTIYFFIAIREFLIIGKLDIKQVFLNPYPDYVSLIIMSISIVFVILLVNQKAVKQKGFDYARTLIEVCERIPVSNHKNTKT